MGLKCRKALLRSISSLAKASNQRTTMKERRPSNSIKARNCSDNSAS